MAAAPWILSGRAAWRALADLLVRKDEHRRVPQLIVVDQRHELVARLADSLAVVGVDHEDERVGAMEVVFPKGSNLGLASDVPHGEVELLVGHSLHTAHPQHMFGGGRWVDVKSVVLVSDMVKLSCL